MATHMSIDSKLLDAPAKAGGLKTNKDTVNLDLQEIIEKRKATEIISLFSKIEYDKDNDYKKSETVRTLNMLRPLPACCYD
jgi:hypothetical protein